MPGKPRSLELFSGGGGLALGLDAAGFEHLALVEWDKDSCATLRANAGTVGNWADADVHELDVREFDHRSLANRVDLLAAGVPCQPFSLGGIHLGGADDRNMFPALLDVIRGTHPKVVLVENVPGLARPAFRPYFEYILAQLRSPFSPPLRSEAWLDHHARLKGGGSAEASLRYRVEWQRVNAANYGVPQRRARIVIQAVREDVSDGCVWPAETHAQAELERAKVDGSYWREHDLWPHVEEGADLLSLRLEDTMRRWRTVRDALVGLPPPSEGSAELFNHIFVPGARAYAGHTGSPLDQPAKTLKAGVHGVPGGEGTIVLDDGTVRYMSVREAARIQTFPDGYRFSGSRTECMRQIGNAVPVRMAEALGRSVRCYLGDSEDELRAAAQ